MATSNSLSDPDIVIDCLKEAAKPITNSFFAAQDGRVPGAIPIGAESQASLERAARETKGSLDTLPRISASNLLMLTTGGGASVIYARPGSDGYRSYVHAMNRLLYDVDVVGSGVSGFDVDHIASRSGSERMGLNYVALVAIDSAANQSYASIESGLCDNADKFGLVRPNLYQILKINNIPLLKSENNTAAGLGIMIGEGVAQGLIPKRETMRYYGIGMDTAARIDQRLGSG